MTDALKRDLAERIAAGKVLVVVGTGVSLAATSGEKLASWKGLIESGVARCAELGLDGADQEWAELRRADLRRQHISDLLGVAEQVERRLHSRGQGDWRGWLRNTVGKLKLFAPAVIQAIRGLGVPIATLNYDELLECLEPRRKFYTWQEAEDWQRVLEGEDNAILHLHGHYERPDTVVLGIRSYEDVLRHDPVQFMQRVVATTHSLLFVGCGSTFEDPNFKALLDWMARTLKHFERRHYLLAKDSDKEAIERLLPPNARIWVLGYGASHDDLLPYLRSLAPKPPGGNQRGDAERPVGHHPPSAVATHNLPQPNRDFTGRGAELEAIQRALATTGLGVITQPQAITGLGGIGKTQLALAYAYAHLSEYKLIRWLPAEKPEALANDYAAMAPALGLDPKAPDQAILITGVRDQLEGRGGWLLVFDNVANPDGLEPYLPRTGTGHVLVTARRTDWRGISQVPLAVMPEGEALELLTGQDDPEKLSPAEGAEAKALANELGYLPLALAQARAYMDEAGRSLVGYRDLLRKSRTAVLARGKANPDYPLSVATTWNLSIEAAATACPAARTLLEVLAFFAPEALPMTVLGADPAALPQDLRDELQRDEAVAELKRFSLIHAEADTITVHRLVQAVTRDALDEATTRTRIETCLRLVYFALPHKAWELMKWPETGKLLPHALETASAAERLGIAPVAAAEVLNEAAHYLEARAAWADATALFGRAVAIVEKILGPERPELAPLLSDLARVHFTVGRYGEAELLLQRSIAIGERTLGPEHPGVGDWLNGLAHVYVQTGRPAEAEPLFRRAIAIDEKTPGAEQPSLASRLSGLALLYHYAGRYAEAEQLFRRAVAIEEKTLDADHPDLATGLNNLGDLYRATGRYAKAEPLLRRSLASREKVLGPKHPDFAETLNNLALLCSETHRLAEAEGLFRRSLAIVEAGLPPNHPRLWIALMNLAELLHQLGRNEEAAELRGRAEPIPIGRQRRDYTWQAGARGPTPGR